MTPVRPRALLLGLLLATSCTRATAPQITGTSSDAPFDEPAILEAPCAPGPAPLRLVAAGIRFNTGCLAARANTAFTITFVNSDPGVNHDVDILPGPWGYNRPPQSLFLGDILPGPRTIVYHVPPLPAGSLNLVCYVHHDVMNVTFGVPPVALALARGRIRVTWATRADAPKGFTFDVQVRAPGSASWETWRARSSDVAAVYSARVHGVYRFRVGQYRAGTSPTGWSPEAAVTA